MVWVLRLRWCPFKPVADSWKQCGRKGDGVTGWLTASTPEGLGAPNYFAGYMVERRSEPLPFSVERVVSCSFAFRLDWFSSTPSYGGSKNWNWDTWWATGSWLFVSSTHVGGAKVSNNKTQQNSEARPVSTVKVPYKKQNTHTHILRHVN